MEYVILGLLSLKARTIYEINKAIEQGVSLFYSASFGSLNIALKKMIQKGWVDIEEKIENGRNKKIYHINDKGRQAFANWLGSEIETTKVKEPALTRLYFLGFAATNEQIKVLKEYLQNLRQTLTTLEFLYQQSLEVSHPKELKQVERFQRLTLDYGIAFYQFNINWFQTIIDELRNENK